MSQLTHFLLLEIQPAAAVGHHTGPFSELHKIINLLKILFMNARLFSRQRDSEKQQMAGVTVRETWRLGEAVKQG